MDDNNVSQNRTRGPNFNWTDELLRLLVTILLDYQKKNGSKQAYNWKVITPTFISKCGKNGGKDFCRNKFESMKKEYKAWKTLRNSETGLGWDENTRMISASNEWWERKIKEDVNCKKYRNKGMDADYEELLSSLFAGSVATGRLAMSSGMVREPSPDHLSLADDDDVALGEGEGDGDDFFRNFVGTVNEGGGSSYSGIAADVNVEPEHSTEPPPPSKGKKDKGPLKRKRRQSIGSSKLEAFLDRSQENSDKLITLFQDEVNSKAKENEIMLQKVLAIVDRMVQNNLIVDGSPLWCFTMSKTNSWKAMQLIVNLGDDQKRYNWLKWEHDQSLM